MLVRFHGHALHELFDSADVGIQACRGGIGCG